MTATPTNEAATFLGQLFSICDQGWVTLFARSPDGRNDTKWAPTTQASRLANDAAALHGWNVWFGCATRREQLDGAKRGGKADCLEIPGLWVDIDIAGPGHATTAALPTEEQAYKLINNFPLAPTCIINSGHGLQPWWALQEPHDLVESDLLARWGATWARLAIDAGGFHLDNVYDDPRIMRLPGTINTKAGCPPVSVTVEIDDWRNRYGVDDIEQYLDAAPPQPVTNNSGIPYIGPERPGDAYNIRHTTSELLAKLGFIPGRIDRDGEQHWKWPAAAGDQSATTYPDGHCAIWSETAAQQLGVRTQWPYDPFGLYTAIHHRGDHAAAARQLANNGYGTPPVALTDLIAKPTPDEPSAEEPDLADFVSPINWTEFWNEDGPTQEWLVEPLVPAGRQVALYSEAKAGKSLLSIEIAVARATGNAVLNQPAGEPEHVIYIDQEMTRDDLEERLVDLGYGPDTDLSHLHYYQLTSLPPLNTDLGGAVVEAIVKRFNATLVVVDTMARVVKGDENDADPYRDFYRYTGLRLKALGVSLLRLDHQGKDKNKGQRGSSAKVDDVDVVFRLTVTDDIVNLKRTHSRVPWVPEEIALIRHTEPTLRHTPTTDAYPSGTNEVVHLLDKLGVATDATYTAAITALKRAGEGKRKAIVLAAMKFRRTRKTVPEPPEPTTSEPEREPHDDL